MYLNIQQMLLLLPKPSHLVLVSVPCSRPGTGPGTEKIQSTTYAGTLNTFGRNEIEVTPNFIGTFSHCVFSNTIQNLLLLTRIIMEHCGALFAKDKAKATLNCH